MNSRFCWMRRHAQGYEVSSKGDRRFSAFNARMPDGRSIEEHYQCDVKGYDPGGRNWRLGKGKPPLSTRIDLWNSYLSLWSEWALSNKPLLDELRAKATSHVLTDMFATTPVNQAHALSVLLNS